VTVSLVDEARGGPFVFWDDLPGACRQAAELGFDAVEVFPPGPEGLSSSRLRELLKSHGLALAAIGTGAGWVRQRLTLTSADPAVRVQALSFIMSIIDLAGPLGASAIIGSMQGRWGNDVDRPQALEHLAHALNSLGEHARQYGVPVIFEPLNRYETNLVNTVAEGVQLWGSAGTEWVVLLADLFHMNIEEADIPGAIRAGKGLIGHVHFVDSNRRPAGLGHLDMGPIAGALKEIGYDGFMSAEALPYPSSREAACQTIAMFQKWFGKTGEPGA
jgi:sugar phosphate isomerase/epimerase